MVGAIHLALALLRSLISCAMGGTVNASRLPGLLVTLPLPASRKVLLGFQGFHVGTLGGLLIGFEPAGTNDADDARDEERGGVGVDQGHREIVPGQIVGEMSTRRIEAAGQPAN